MPPDDWDDFGAEGYAPGMMGDLYSPDGYNTLPLSQPGSDNMDMPSARRTLGQGQMNASRKVSFS